MSDLIEPEMNDVMPPIEEAEFDAMLAENDGLVLVDFWADWCGPCKAVTPVLTRLADEFQGHVPFFKVNADQNRRLMSAFNVRSIPTVILLKTNPDGPGATVVSHRVGARSEGDYRAMIQDALTPKPSLWARCFGWLTSKDS